MKRKIFAFIILTIYLSYMFSCTVFAKKAEMEINVIVAKDGFVFDYIKSAEKPILDADVTLIPLRAVAEAFNFTILWNDAEQSVVVSNQAYNVKMWLNDTKAIVNGEQKYLSLSPRMINEKTFVPLRMFCEFLGLNVFWEQLEQNTAYIWISPFKLLDYNDVQPDNNYYQLDQDVPYYILKDTGKTVRGIALGDSYKKVLAVYGIPHNYIDTNSEIKKAEYYTPYLPNSSSGNMLTFLFEDNRVVEITLEG